MEVYGRITSAVSSEENCHHQELCELETLRTEVLHLKETVSAQENLRMKSEQKSVSLEKTLQEVASAQGSLIAFFTERLKEEESAKEKLRSENSSLASKLKKFQDAYLPSSTIWPYNVLSKEKCKVEVVKERASKEKQDKVSPDLSEEEENFDDSNGLESKIHDLNEQVKKRIKLATDIELIMKYTVKQLNDVNEQLNEKKEQVDKLQQQLDLRESEMNEVISRLEEEKCARKELQSENFGLDSKLKKFEENFATFESSNHKVINENKLLEERLAETSTALAEEKKKSKELVERNITQEVAIVDLKELLLKECPVTEDFEIIQHLTETELNTVRKNLNEKKDQVDELRQKLCIKESVLNQVRCELEGRESALKILQLENVSLNSQLKKLEEHITALEINNSKVIKEKEITEEKLAEVSRALSIEKEKVKHFIDVKTYQELTIDDLKEQLKNERQHNAYLERAKSNLKAEKSKLANKISTLSMSTTDLERKKNQLEKEAREFKTELTDTKYELTKCRKLLQEKTRLESVSSLGKAQFKDSETKREPV